MNKLKSLKIHWKNPEASLQIRQKWENSSCQHQRAELDVTSRTVFCALCEQQIDAFDFLVDQAVKENSLFARIDSLEMKKKQLEREILRQKRILTKVP